MKLLWWLLPVGALAAFALAKEASAEESGDGLTTLTPFNPDGKRILLIGDSLSASRSSPGGQLEELLEAAGADVIRNGLGARSYRSFFLGRGAKTAPEPSPAADQIADDLPVDIALLLLGTNDTANVAITKDQEAAEKVVLKSASSVLGLFPGDVRVIGLGPPSFGPEVKSAGGGVPLQTAAQSLVPKLAGLYTEFLDNRPLTADLLTKEQGRKGDGIHFADKGATLWAKRMFRALTGEDA